MKLWSKFGAKIPKNDQVTAVWSFENGQFWKFRIPRQQRTLKLSEMVENLLKLSYLHRFLIFLHQIWTHCLMLAILYSKRVSNHLDENYRLGKSFCLDGKRVFLRGYIFKSAIFQEIAWKLQKLFWHMIENIFNLWLNK